MLVTYNPNIFQRTNIKLASTKPMAKLFSYTFHHLDRPIIKWSNSRQSATGLLTGLPIVTLTTTGAKTGQARSVPLIGVPNGDDIILIASNWGGQRHPSWYHNLTAYPTCTLTFDGKTEPYIARETTGDEKEICWNRAVSCYSGYTAYKQRVDSREIPVMVLNPDN